MPMNRFKTTLAVFLASLRSPDSLAQAPDADQIAPPPPPEPVSLRPLNSTLDNMYAGHRSHSSHRSHRSGSGSYGYSSPSQSYGSSVAPSAGSASAISSGSSASAKNNT